MLVSTPENLKTKQGLEISNFVGPIYLTNLLMPLLKKANQVRVVNVASIGHIWGDERESEIPNYFLLKSVGPSEFSSSRAYTKSKFDNVYFTSRLAELLENSGHTNIMTVFLHQGIVRTDLSRG